MDVWWSSLSALQQVLFFVAAPATLILIIQTILVLIGHGGETDSDVSDVSGLHDFSDAPDVTMDHDIDVDHDIDTDHDFSDAHSVEHDSGFSLFSVRGIMAFFAVGGFLGIAMLDVDGVSDIIAMLIALAGGFLALVAIAYLMHSIYKLQSSGNLNINNAVGKTAVVYIPISEKQPGKITVTFQERYTELLAISNEPLPTNTFVKIVKVIDGETVYVEKINDQEEN